jgi:carbon monoxide dehydrogenase subunit G
MRTMQFTDVRRVAARPADVWDALHDREVLAATIPGCDRLIPLGEGEYAAIVSAPVDGDTDTYRGLLTLTDTWPGTELHVSLAGRGRCGTLEVDVRVRLERDSTTETTQVRYDARAASPVARDIVAGLERSLWEARCGSVAV